MKKQMEHWMENNPPMKDEEAKLFLTHLPATRSLAAFLSRFLSDEKFAARALFHCGEPLHSMAEKNDEDPEKVEVILFHLRRFPLLPYLLENAKKYRDKRPEESSKIWKEIDDTLHSLFSVDTEEITCSCTHDCCAHWFTRGFSIKVSGNLVRMKREWRMNI